MIRAMALLALAACGAAHADEGPLWELGAGVGALSFPDYRGSSRQRSYVLPVPMVVYRGEVFQADRERVRGVFFRTAEYDVDVSVNGSVPVESDGGGAREGMDDLDPTLEIGPSFNWKLVQGPRHTLTFRLPVRAVIASDFRSVHAEGVIANPSLNLDFRMDHGWKLGLQAGVLAASRRYHAYFYDVASDEARPGRPAFQAAGGYSGAQLVASLTRRFDRWFVGGFVKADFLGGAAFLASPLIERRDNITAGLAVTYVLARSPRIVSVPD